jgi:hypothetical protein
MTSRIDSHTVTMSVAFSTTRDEIYLRAYPVPPRQPYDGELRLTRRDALALARQLTATLHHLGLPWHELFPTADELPDETPWSRP